MRRGRGGGGEGIGVGFSCDSKKSDLRKMFHFLRGTWARVFSYPVILNQLEVGHLEVNRQLYTLNASKLLQLFTFV